MQKFKWKVLQPMSWRSEEKVAGDIIIDSDNTYMRAMVHQEKLEQLEEA
jgi:hypothetical protein